MEAVESNQQRQEDEIAVLKAIYGEEAVETIDSNTFILHTPVDGTKAQADICFHLPDTYPSDDIPMFEWIGARDTSADTTMPTDSGYIYVERSLALSNDMRLDMEREMHRLWDENQCRDVVIFSWTTWLSEYLERHWPQPLDPIPLPSDNNAGPDIQGSCSTNVSTGKGASRTANKQPIDVDEPLRTRPEIFTGVPLEMKKSIFVGHVARVGSAKDVQVVLETLLQDKKIAQATHNISAYRICLDNGSISQDNDDDGESAAGKRLGHLLQLLEVENVMVVVTRWYGGTHLGPDRFKLINSAARQALETGGFLDNPSRR
ncbi:hypothetical protein EV175_000614, partial [Coemansia sp. RSA 1933]